MGNTVIKVENLSKQYRLGLVGASTFKEDASRWWAKMRGKEDPFLSLGVENDRTSISDSKFVWSLKDINFEVKQGDVMGIVGRNGAGKSTLLKILSKITSPTTGTVKAKGRIASLLEVGTGFHPELTGRENIYLNGAILGMRKHEIKSKLDEIIAFAGVERYIDTPVKRYSSGMYVRLAFAVAAHLENEILIIDEVLAVGDADFQKKCLGKMGEVSRGEGRTVLFVSHNPSAVRSLCTRALLLNNGKIEINDNVSDVLSLYSGINDFKSGVFKFENINQSDVLQVLEVNLIDIETGLITGIFQYGASIKILLKINLKKDISRPHFWLMIGKSEYYFTCASNMVDGMNVKSLKKGENHLSCTFINVPLFSGIYSIRFGARDETGLNGICESRDIAMFNIETLPSENNLNGSLADIVTKEIPPTLINYQWGDSISFKEKYLENK